MKRVLLVDDEPLLLEELQDSLELEGYEVAVASGVDEGLKKFGQARFDAIVTDLKMPKRGGLDLIRTLRDEGATCMIVVVSGHGAETNRADAMALGASACLAKPLDVDDLIEVLQ